MADNAAARGNAASGDSVQGATQPALDAAGAFNRDHGDWVYEIDPSWMHAARTTQKDLLE